MSSSIKKFVEPQGKCLRRRTFMHRHTRPSRTKLNSLGEFHIRWATWKTWKAKASLCTWTERNDRSSGFTMAMVSIDVCIRCINKFMNFVTYISPDTDAQIQMHIDASITRHVANIYKQISIAIDRFTIKICFNRSNCCITGVEDAEESLTPVHRVSGVCSKLQCVYIYVQYVYITHTYVASRNLRRNNECHFDRCINPNHKRNSLLPLVLLGIQCVWYWFLIDRIDRL